MKKTTEKKLVCELLGISEKSYYRWVKERKIFDLLELYFSREDLQEFLETGKINKYENIDTITSASWSSFFQQIETLHKSLLPHTINYFYDFIVHYIKSRECIFAYWDENEDWFWDGFDELRKFQNHFYQYLLDVKISSDDLRAISEFINNLKISDLIFLNILIKNGVSSPISLHNNYVNIHAYNEFIDSMCRVFDIKKSDNMLVALNKAINEAIKKNIKEVDDRYKRNMENHDTTS